jgi:hypothetical protein
MITQEYLKSLLHYDSETGVFTWIVSPARNVKIGSVAGFQCIRYWLITIKGKSYLAHRLAWLYVYGEWPVSIIDHIDRNGMNNKIANLRQATYSQNALNKPSSRKNALGVKGVSYAAHAKKYLARAVLNGKHHHLGLFLDVESASAAYQAFARENHGEFLQTNDKEAL